MPKTTCNEGLVQDYFQRFKICFENLILDILFQQFIVEYSLCRSEATTTQNVKNFDIIGFTCSVIDSNKINQNHLNSQRAPHGLE